MPRRPDTSGKPDDLVYLHLRVPVWLKRRAVEKAKGKAQDLTEYIKGLMVADLGDKAGGAAAREKTRLPENSGGRE